jgi:hypothetical protein
MTTTSRKIFAFAVIPSQGCYSSGQTVYTVYRTNDLAAARAKAAKLTAAYRKQLAAHGGSSGGYRAVQWNQPGNVIQFGHHADRYATV